MGKAIYHLIGSAFGHGAKIYSTAKGPGYLRDNYGLHQQLGPEFVWSAGVQARDWPETQDHRGLNYEAVLQHNRWLAGAVGEHIHLKDGFPVIIGGDHSCGIGTWSGAISALGMQQKFGLIWLDAHMDAHVPETSHSKSFHGMPLSHLLGYGDPELRQIGLNAPKLKPKHLVLIGIRSYEREERAFLEQQNITVFYVEDIERLGIETVLQKAMAIATNGTDGFGVSLDIDVFDPELAPGTGCHEPGGLVPETLLPGLPQLFSSPQLRCLEIAEFDPALDRNQMTSDLIRDILRCLKEVRK